MFQICHNDKFYKTSNANNNNQNKFSIINGVINQAIRPDNCWKKRNEQFKKCNSKNKAKIVCQIYNNFGHVAEDCRSKIRQDATSSGLLFYRYCKKQGHLLDNCEYIASNNRR